MRSREKMRRKMALVSIIALLAVNLTACGVGNRRQDDSSGPVTGQNRNEIENSREDGKLQVVATIFPYYDFIREIAGDLVDIHLMVPAGMDTHSFEPTAADMINVGKADLIIYNGGEMETWVEQVLEAAQNPNLKADAMMNHVEVLMEEHVEGMEEEHRHEGEPEEDEHDGHRDESEEYHETPETEEGHEDSGGELDEHIWTSPVYARNIVRQIAADLIEVDPENQQTYEKNADAYIKKLKALDREFRDIVAGAKRNYLIFGDRFPLRYFVEEYGLEYSAAFAGCSSDTEPSVDTIAYLTERAKEEQVPVVLKIELTSDKVAKTIAEAAGSEGRTVKVETLYTCHNVTKEQFDAGESYLSLMEHNLGVLKEALE